MRLGKNEQLILKYLKESPGNVPYQELRDLFSDSTHGAILCSQAVSRLVEKGLITYFYVVKCDREQLKESKDYNVFSDTVVLWTQKGKPDVHRCFRLPESDQLKSNV